MSDESRIERRHVRVQLGEKEGVLSEVWAGESTSVRGTVTVLGSGGACLDIDETIPIGSPLSLSFRLPGTSEQIVCGGVVRNKDENGVGVEFFLVSPADRERITAAVMERHLIKHPRKQAV